MVRHQVGLLDNQRFKLRWTTLYIDSSTAKTFHYRTLIGIDAHPEELDPSFAVPVPVHIRLQS